MATTEHCLYCFEALAAHLERRESLNLEGVELSWKAYKQATAEDEDAAKKRNPAIDRLSEATSLNSSNLSTPASGSSMSLATDTPATSTSSLPTPADAPLVYESPLFVTWNKLSERTGTAELRGCIGTFETEDLDDGLGSYAVTSAVRDTRFKPMALRELPSLEVAVTLLTDFEDCKGGPRDWELGTHGIRISFVERGRRYGATYLPDVATEQGWDKEETLLSLMRKAGWTGDRSRWEEVGDLKVVRYQGKKKSLPYADFKAWRDWADKNPTPEAESA